MASHPETPDASTATTPADASPLESLGKAIAEPMRAAAAPDEAQLDATYRALQAGTGREQVSRANVNALIARARERGHPQIEALLRDWRPPGGDEPEAPAR